MLFYALRIRCHSCGSNFLAGGSPEQDLSRWREATVACPRCGAETSAEGARAVSLRTKPSPGKTLEERGEPTCA